MMSAFQIHTDISIKQMKKNENIFMQLFLHITFNLPRTLKYVLLREEERARDLFLLPVSIKVICCHGDIYIFAILFFQHSLHFRFWGNSCSLSPLFTEPRMWPPSPLTSRTGKPTWSHTTFDRDFFFCCLYQREPLGRVRERAFQIPETPDLASAMV